MLQQLDTLLRFDLVHFDQILQANTDRANDRQFCVPTFLGTDSRSNTFLPSYRKRNLCQVQGVPQLSAFVGSTRESTILYGGHCIYRRRILFQAISINLSCGAY